LSALLHALLTAKVKEEIDCIRELEQTEMHMKETTLALIRQCHMHAWKAFARWFREWCGHTTKLKVQKRHSSFTPLTVTCRSQQEAGQDMNAWLAGQAWTYSQNDA
jgi:hypothetical protein